MLVVNAFKLNPLNRAVKLVVLAPLLLLAQQVVAGPINGGSQTIDQNTPADSYTLTNKATLTANGATTQQITAGSGSTVILNGGTVNAAGTQTGLSLVDANAQINDSSRINSSTTGLSLGFTAAGTGSQATVNNSVISGGNLGARVSARSTLTLSNSELLGTGATGIGLQMFGGTVSATGSTIAGGQSGVVVRADTSQPGGSTLDLDSTRVQGSNGAAILIQGGSADISVRNGSSLTGSNGTILNVTNGGSSDFSVSDASTHLVGDVVVENGSTANVTLANSATLTGNLQNVQALTVNNQARWVMVGDGSVQSLTLNGGGVQFGNPGEFFKLNVAELSGSGGTFYMHNNFGTGQIDTLTVTGTASGNHLVALDSSGSEPGAASSTPVVHIGAGDATFALAGGAVSLGAFDYDLVKAGNNDWYLDTATRTISPGTQSVMALFNAAPTVWYGELSTLRTRMGEIRLDQDKAGGWIRAYGNKYDVSASSGVAYQQTQQGISFGADAPLPVGDGQWLVGLLGGYSKSDLNMSRGTTGEVDSYYLGAYTTWMDEKSGYYVDGVLKFNRFQNSSDVSLSDGAKTKGDYDNNGVGASVEFGRHIKLDDGYFVEPYTQLSGLVIQGANYDLDNGLTAEGDRTRSLLAKAGATVGRNISLGEGKVVQPYVRAAYVHEFASSSDVKVNDNPFNTDLSGSRGELGAGFTMTLTDKVSMHVDLDYSNGEKIEQPWGANVGMRYSW
ncbi:autotransporter outer membrane beta-barrel domain-containing protein [Pseudomonas sp. N3-W]|uniref:autotransporter outer membrane beta-barrel domain-containing protein n=1 Tax=Pseudomonas sp. N3-W TaxID=2975049 RepID=UPI00217CE841|nr:autotransporter outer membrane beta-barrel domain-containing protein [Pseudomonas sp. N3-W]UWF46983.1 autotransporter outer membrane beta-barrel domain-containing protein [Pseudomonas sp. N3-W]